MNTIKRRILERAFAAEINAAQHDDPALGLIQSKSKHIPDMINEGLLTHGEVVIPGPLPVRVKGYAITTYGILVFSRDC